MPIELTVPAVGESITEVVIAAWHKQVGEAVEMDETVAELESDKATLELPAPATGVLTQVLKHTGDSAKIGEIIGYLEAGATATTFTPPPAAAAAPVAPVISPPTTPVAAGAAPTVMPAAARVLAEKQLAPQDIAPSGPGGRLLKEDVLAHQPPAAPPPVPVTTAMPPRPRPVANTPVAAPAAYDTSAFEQVVPMSPIRRKIAERLLDAQQSMAMLTTFNEIDMSAVMQLRKSYQERFTQTHGVKLGFMSFFVKAAVEALKLVPQANAEIRGTDIIYKNHYDIGIAVGGGKGLVVPVIRGADRMSYAEIELAIADFGQRAQANKIELEELKGGTFTISNGGVYGSLLSTPIINPPQSGVLGLHAIQDRPVARDGQVVIRPMMYIALTYDHRIIDGRESVAFLKRIKELLEDPARLILEI